MIVTEKDKRDRARAVRTNPLLLDDPVANDYPDAAAAHIEWITQRTAKVVRRSAKLAISYARWSFRHGGNTSGIAWMDLGHVKVFPWSHDQYNAAVIGSDRLTTIVTDAVSAINADYPEWKFSLETHKKAPYRHSPEYYEYHIGLRAIPAA